MSPDGRPPKPGEDAARLRARVAELQAEQRELCQRLKEVESHNQLLQTLFVTTYQLHAAADTVEVLATLEEILTNLVGADQFGVWTAGADGAPGQLVLEHGLRGAARELTRAERRLAQASIALDAWFDDGRADPRSGVDAIAIVPLRARTRVVGLLVIRKFLDHKPALGKNDRQVLGLVAEQAGIAIASSEIRGRRTRSA